MSREDELKEYKGYILEFRLLGVKNPKITESIKEEVAKLSFDEAVTEFEKFVGED